MQEDSSEAIDAAESCDQVDHQQSNQQQPGICEMCQNYETNLTIMQDGERKLKEELKAMKELADRYQNELTAEREYR